jgi:hypothetical protein
MLHMIALLDDVELVAVAPGHVPTGSVAVSPAAAVI